MFTLTLPAKPDLEILQKQAQALHRLHKTAKPEAANRLRAALPEFSTMTEAEVFAHSLSQQEARQAIAGEYGFEHWRALETRLRAMPITRSPVYRLSPSSREPKFLHQKAAKLMTDLADGNEKAYRRVSGHLPGWRAADPSKPAIIDEDQARQVIASEYGFEGFSDLLTHLDWLLERKEPEPYQRVIDAVEAADGKTLRTLIGQYPLLVNAGDCTPLERVAQMDASALPDPVARDMIETLTEAGAVPDLALIVAGCFGRGENIRCLLRAGARIDAAYKWNLTALESAVLHGQTEIGDLLSAYGLFPDTLWIAAGSGRLEAVKGWFDERGNLKPGAGSKRPNFADAGHEPGLPPRDEPGEIMAEAFLAACQNDRRETAAFLLERGVSINATGYADLSGLHFAAWFGKPQMVRFLLQKGADATLLDDQYGATALGYAEACGQTEIAQILKEAGG